MQTAPTIAVPMGTHSHETGPKDAPIDILLPSEAHSIPELKTPKEPIHKPIESKATGEQHSGDPLGDFLGLFAIKTFIPDASHFLSIIGNGAAAVANLCNLSDGVKNFADKFGYIGTKIFLVLNGFINSLEYLHKKNLLGAVGHFMDVIVGIGASHDHIYLDRGNPVGIYTYANTICNMNGKTKFNTFNEHFDHIKLGMQKSVQNLFTKDFFRNFADVNKGMLGILSGILCNAGAIIWHTTGKEELATIVRDGGGFLVDLEQAHPGHYQAGRKFYFYSGLGLIGGTVCDLLSKLLPYYKKSLVPLSLAIDGFGRYLLRVSHNRGEIGKKEVEIQAKPIPVMVPELVAPMHAELEERKLKAHTERHAVNKDIMESPFDARVAAAELAKTAA